MSAPIEPPSPGGPVPYTPTPVPQSAHQLYGEAPAPTGRRFSRLTLGIAAGVLVVVGAGSFFLLDSMLSPGREQERHDGLTAMMEEVSGPEHVVQGYLDALADGNVRGAWAIASGTLDYSEEPGLSDAVKFPVPALLIDNQVYRESESLPSNPAIDSVKFKSGGKAEVTVSFGLGDSQFTQEFVLTHKDDASTSTVYEWAFEKSPIGQIDVVAPATDHQVLVNGANVTSWVENDGTLSLPAMVGSYTFQLIDKEGKEVDTAEAVLSSTDKPVAVQLGS